MTDDTPISWRAIVYGTPVFEAGGRQVGTVREVLGSDAEDTFHGVRLARDRPAADDVVVPADAVSSITRSRIDVSLSEADLAALPRYNEEATYHLASVGWLRRHLGWARDSEHDEEAG